MKRICLVCLTTVKLKLNLNWIILIKMKVTIIVTLCNFRLIWRKESPILLSTLIQHKNSWTKKIRYSFDRNDLSQVEVYKIIKDWKLVKQNHLLSRIFADCESEPALVEVCNIFPSSSVHKVIISSHVQIMEASMKFLQQLLIRTQISTEDKMPLLTK